jgi:hypothetical protein
LGNLGRPSLPPRNRFVVASPSSYAYFSPDRPAPAIAGQCPGYNEWKYGMDSLPAYAGSTARAELKKTYVARRVIYMLGALDVDPNNRELDKSCMAEAQGPVIAQAERKMISARTKAALSEARKRVAVTGQGEGRPEIKRLGCPAGAASTNSACRR